MKVSTGSRFGVLVVTGEAKLAANGERRWWALCTVCGVERATPLLAVQLRRHAASKAGRAGVCTCPASSRAHAWRERKHWSQSRGGGSR